MKRTLLTALCGLMVIALPAITSLAEGGQSDETGAAAGSDAPEPIVIELAQQETEPARPVPYDEPTDHDLSYADVEKLGRLPWDTPLISLTEKEALLWVAVNRIGVAPYGATLAEVINSVEFEWYDADDHLSAENEQLARDVLNAWLSEREGLWINRLVPRSGVKVRFIGSTGRMQVLDKNGVCVWESD